MTPLEDAVRRRALLFVTVLAGERLRRTAHTRRRIACTEARNMIRRLVSDVTNQLGPVVYAVAISHP